MVEKRNQKQESAVNASVGRLLTVVAGLDDSAERARITATAIPSLLPCELSGVALLEADGSNWTLAAQCRGSLLDQQQADRILTETRSLLLQALERGHLLVAPSNEGAPSGEGSGLDGSLPPSLVWMKVARLAAAPLLTLRRRIGALLVGWEEDREPSSLEASLVSRIAEGLSIGLENLRLMEALERHSENLEDLVSERTRDLQRSEEKHRVLLEVTRAVSSHRDRQALFEAIAASVAPIVKFDRMAILLRQTESPEMTVYALEAKTAGPRIQPGVSFPIEGTAPGWVLEQQRPFIGSNLEDYRDFPVSREVLAKEGIKSSCLLPLVLNRRATGVLLFLSKRTARYDDVDASFLLEVADAVAVALDDCLAYEEISRLKDRLQEENVYLQEEIRTRHDFSEIIGSSSAIEELLQAVETVAPTDATVLILGETGTGKELFARAVHDLSGRKDKALVKVNCAAIPSGLIESELFGHERGAFTGATARRTGRFELADGGTIFLDEIGELPIDLQAKLLRVLQEGEFERVGGSRTFKVDSRVIAATNSDLEQAVANGEFRSDLYYRLNVFPMKIPPLRERREDILPLARHFIDRLARQLGKNIDTVSRSTVAELEAYPWPGNVRELENIIERAVIISDRSTLDVRDWLRGSSVASEIEDGRTSESERTLDEVNRNHILSVLEETRWRVSGERGAARILGIKPTTLASRMKKLGIKRPPK